MSRIESVPVEAAQALAERVPVFPPPFALRVAQDRLLEKNCFRSLGIGTALFEAVDSLEDLTRAVEILGLPAVLKTRRLAMRTVPGGTEETAPEAGANP